MLSAPLMLLTHELLSHGVATLAFGAHIVRVTSVYENWSGALPHPAARATAAAGIAANLLYGALALLAFRLVPKAHAETRFFLSFYGHATVFMGSGYLMAGAIVSFGDVDVARQMVAGVYLDPEARSSTTVGNLVVGVLEPATSAARRGAAPREDYMSIVLGQSRR